MVDDSTWTEATEAFIEAAPALTALHGPQLRSLRALAEQLDAAETYSATLAAEYARIHRWLLNKISGGKSSEPEMSESDSILDMFNSNPGVWK